MKHCTVFPRAISCFAFIFCMISLCKAQAPTNFSQYFTQEFDKNMRYMDSLSNVYTPPLGPFPDFESQDSKESVSLLMQRGKFFPFGNYAAARKADSMMVLRLLTSPNCSNGDWQPVGPIGDPIGVNGVSDYYNKNGRLDCITFHPTNTNILYVGSGGGGGLWKVNTVSKTSQSMNTDRISLHTGVSSVVAVPGRVVVATGRRYVPVRWDQWESSCTGIYYTNDDGATWNKSTVNDTSNHDPFGYGSENRQWVAKMIVHPTNPDIMYMTSFNIHLIFNKDEKAFGGLYKSTDGGITWNEVNDTALKNRYFTDIEFHPTNPDIIYLSGHRLYKSVNGGTSWTDVTAFLTNLPARPSDQNIWYTYQILLAVPNKGCSTGDGDHLVIFVQPGQAPNRQSYDTTFLLYHSTDAISSSVVNIISPTERIKPRWPVPYHGSITMTHDPDILYVAGQVFQRSEDGGQTFSTNHGYGNESHPDNQDIAIPPFNGSNAGILYKCTDGGLWKSTDSGDTFTPMNDGLMINQFYGIGVSQSDNTVIAGAQDNFNMRLRNDGVWQALGSGDGSKSTPINSNDPEIFAYNDLQRASVIKTRIRNSTNNISNISISISNSNGFSPYKYLHTEPNTLLIATDRMYKVVNGAVTPSNLFSSSLGADSLNWFNGNTAVAFDYCFAQPNVIYVSTTGQWLDANGNLAPHPLTNYNDTSGYNTYNLFKSTNSGSTWTNISTNLPGFTGQSSPTVDPTNPDHVWLTWTGYARGNGLNQNVLESTDGGITWSPYYDGLPLGSTKDLVYQHGTNGRLFLNLENSIYFRDASMSQWECYDKNMPITTISDMEISYCSGDLYASTFGRGVWKTKIVQDNDVLGTGTIINTNTIWSATAYVTGNVKVTNGATLTISGANTVINMAKNSTITVEPGAKLIVNDATLTNNCKNCMWLGIEAKGNWNLAQTAANQGTVILNNATIKHARNAVMNWGAYTGGGAASTGGIISALNTTFENCRRSVAFNEYTEPITSQTATYYNQYKASFSRCKFIIDEGYKGDDINSQFEEHVALYKVNHVKFQGCEFYNRLTNSRKGLGIGLHAAGSSFSINSYVNPSTLAVTPSKFTGFKFGVMGESYSMGHYAASIDHAVFDSCGIGIRGINYPELKATANTFTVGNGTYAEINQSECYKNIGIFTTACSDAIIEGNTATGTTFTGQHASLEKLGIVIGTSGGNNKTVYKNTLTNLDFGIAAIEDNADRPALTGLRIYCNSFQDNTKDINISDYQPYGYFSGIAMHQGNITIPAGNTFTTTSTPLNIYNNVLDIYYYYGRGNTENPDVQQLSSSIHLKPTGTTNGCPSGYETLNGNSTFARATTAARYFNYQTVKEGLQSDYASLIDGGSTVALLGYLNNKTIDDSADVYNELMGNAPWLSYEVLMAAGDAGVLSPGLLTAVVIANPELIDDELIEHFENNIPYTLTAQNLTDIDAVIGTFSERSHMEADIALYGSEMERLKDMIIIDIKLDTTGTDMDSIATWYNRTNTLEAEYSKISFYSEYGDYDAALAAIDNLPNKFTLSSQQEAEYNLYLDYFNLLHAVHDSGRSIFTMNATETATLTAIYDEATTIGFKQIIYNRKTLTDAPNPEAKMICSYLLVGSSTNSPKVILQKKSQPEQDRITTANTLTVYPNPANDHIVFEYNVPNSKGVLRLTIVSPKGDKVRDIELSGNAGSRYIDTHQFTPGIYIYQLSDATKVIQTGKVVISQ